MEKALNNGWLEVSYAVRLHSTIKRELCIDSRDDFKKQEYLYVWIYSEMFPKACSDYCMKWNSAFVFLTSNYFSAH